MAVDVKIERQIVTGMIVNDEFLRGVSSIFKDQLRVPFANRVAGWCMDYYKQYQEAPTKHIKDIFLHHSKNGLPDEEKFLISEFLDRLSKKYVKSSSFNVPYILDNTEEYFRLLALEELKRDLDKSLEKGKITKAENLVKKFEHVVRPETSGVDPFSKDAIRNTFDEQSSDVLFKFPGELGEEVGYFEREYLAAYFGVRGTGKTWWLLWTGLLAVTQGYNVVFVSLEMSEKQVIKRIHQYLTALPTRAYKDPIMIPRFHEEGVTTYFKETRRDELSLELALRRTRDLDDTNLFRAKFKLLTYPSGTHTVGDLKTQLTNMEYYDDFIPDVIITDYADKFRAEKGGERRHQLEEVWNQHKALAQEKKCFVVTASQTNTSRTGVDIGVGSAAECIEKENLCDLIFALNQKPDEKKAGLMRLSLTKHRHDDYDIMRKVYVTQCLKIGRPYLDSRSENNFKIS